MMERKFTTDEIINLIREHSDAVGFDNDMYRLACQHLVELFELVGGKKTLEELIDERKEED